MSDPYNRHPFQAFGLAILVEIALLAAAATLLTWVASVKPAQSEPVPIVLANEEPAPVKPPEPKPEPPKPKPKPITPPPKATPQPPPPLEIPAERPKQTPMVQVPTAFTEPVPPPAPLPQAVKTDNAKPSAEYAAKVHAAVQAAHYYPPAAAALHYSGRVRVEFHLRDKIPSESRILVASGLGIIDRAALQAVQNAQYPTPPAELVGIDLIYQVWVEFNR